jgi:hypothetical protein
MSAPETPDQSSPSQSSPRLFWVGLLLITLVGFAIRLYAGKHEHMSYDEWQHVFMASGARMTDVLYEVRTNAHPLLFFLLLRGLLKLGHAQLLYRSISILAGTCSIVLVGLIARRVLRSQVLQLLCVAAFTLSASAIIISIQVRSYQLAVVMVLLAFLSYLDMIPAPRGPVSLRPYVIFAIASSLAVWSLYASIFFVGASIAVPAVLAAVSGSFRKRLIAGLSTKSVCLSVASFALPCFVFAGHLDHMRQQVIQGYVYDFYWGMKLDETVSGFVLTNARNFFNLFSPLQLESPVVFLLIIIALGVAGLWAYRRALRGEPGMKADSLLPVAFAAVMVAGLLAASLARQYPFGGLMRHQYIVAPFLLLAAFVFLDALSALAAPVLRRGISILVGAAILANPAFNWEKVVEFPDSVVLTNEFGDYSAAFPQARAVYVDSFSVWGYFVHTDDGARRFVRRVTDPAWIDEYRIQGGGHDGTLIFYDKTRFHLSFSDPSLYESLAACLRQSGVDELVLFWFAPGDTPVGQDTVALQKLIREKAAEQGLTATKLFVPEGAVFASFRLAAR